MPSTDLVNAIGEMVQLAAHQNGGPVGPIQFTLCGRGSQCGTKTMLNETTKKLTPEQAAIVNEITARFDVDAAEIVFFGTEPRPLIGYEATCVMANALVPDLQALIIEPVQSVTTDSVSMLCTIKLADGRSRAAVGVANVLETADDDQMSEQQLQHLASSRAVRNTLRVAGIDLLRLMRTSSVGRTGDAEFSGPPQQRSNRDNLLAHTHILGQELGYIRGDDKTLWRQLLNNRYGVESSIELSDPQLSDFAALLSSIRSPFKQAA